MRLSLKTLSVIILFGLFPQALQAAIRAADKLAPVFRMEKISRDTLPSKIFITNNTVVFPWYEELKKNGTPYFYGRLRYLYRTSNVNKNGLSEDKWGNMIYKKLVDMYGEDFHKNMEKGNILIFPTGTFAWLFESTSPPEVPLTPIEKTPPPVVATIPKEPWKIKSEATNTLPPDSFEQVCESILQSPKNRTSIPVIQWEKRNMILNNELNSRYQSVKENMQRLCRQYNFPLEQSFELYKELWFAFDQYTLGKKGSDSVHVVQQNQTTVQKALTARLGIDKIAWGKKLQDFFDNQKHLIPTNTSGNDERQQAQQRVNLVNDQVQDIQEQYEETQADVDEFLEILNSLWVGDLTWPKILNQDILSDIREKITKGRRDFEKDLNKAQFKSQLLMIYSNDEYRQKIVYLYKEYNKAKKQLTDMGDLLRKMNDVDRNKIGITDYEVKLRFIEISREAFEDDQKQRDEKRRGEYAEVEDILRRFYYAYPSIMAGDANNNMAYKTPQELEAEINKLSQLLDNAQWYLDNMTQERDALQSYKDNLEEKLQASLLQIRTLEETLKDLQGENENLSSDNQSLQEELTNTETDLNKTMVLVQETQSQVTSLKQAKQNLTDTNNEMFDEQQELKKKYQDNISELTQEQQILLKQYNDLQEQLNMRLQNQKEQEWKVESLKKQSTRLQQQITNEKNKNSKLQKEMDDLQKTIQKLQKENVILTEQLKEAEEDADSITIEDMAWTEELTHTIELLEKKIAKLESNNKSSSPKTTKNVTRTKSEHYKEKKACKKRSVTKNTPENLSVWSCFEEGKVIVMTSWIWIRKDPVGAIINGKKIHKKVLHTWCDYRWDKGNKLKAMTSWEVVDVWKGYNGGYGNQVIIKTIDNGKTYYRAYNHMQTIKVGKGDKVTQGTIIGTLGNTWRSTGPHVHIEVYSIEDGVIIYYDVSGILKANGYTVKKK